MKVCIDVLPLVLEAHRVLVAEVIGGYYGQASLGRWWLPSALLEDGEQPTDCAARIVREQLGLDLEGIAVVAARQQAMAGERIVAIVLAGSVGGVPDPKAPVSGFSARLLSELPDQIGFYHRDEIAFMASRYERLRA